MWPLKPYLLLIIVVIMGINNVIEPAIGKDAAGRWQVQALSWLQSEFQASLRGRKALGVPWNAPAVGLIPKHC